MDKARLNEQRRAVMAQSAERLAQKYDRWAARQDELGDPTMAARMREQAAAARRKDWRAFGLSR